MDIWSFIWILIALLVWPFGYKPIIFLLIISSIFQGSAFFSFGSTNITLFFGLEMLVILRLLLPTQASGVPKFNDKTSLNIFLIIIIFWLYTFFATNFFSGMRVYSTLADSFESNYITRGLPLEWSKKNFSELIFLSTNLILSLLIYKRKEYITKDFFIKSIFISAFIFSIVSFFWQFYKPFYTFISLIFFNNPGWSITVLSGVEDRMASTFPEPSYAGLYISTLALPFLFREKFIFKIFGIVMLYWGYLNFSSTFFVGLILSIVLIFLYYKQNNLKNSTLIFISTLFFILLFLYSFNSLFIEYFSSKMLSGSGEIRNDSNHFAIEAFINSYFIGVGIGSIRASSLLLSMLANFGLVLFIYTLYVVYKLFSLRKEKDSKFLFMLLLIAFFASFSSIPDYSLPFLWILIFANIASSKINK